MKFEQVLQIYWSKGFLYNGRILPFTLTLKNFISELDGFNRTFLTTLIKRFELNTLNVNYDYNFTYYPADFIRAINVMLSQVSSVNNSVSELNKYNLVRLYLIKSYRGKAQALGKPSHGQRTWSNAWTAYNYNRTIRSFVSTIQKTLNKNKVEEKINYKLIKRKLKKSTKIKGVGSKKIKPSV